jgi:hypothetical protein
MRLKLLDFSIQISISVTDPNPTILGWVENNGFQTFRVKSMQFCFKFETEILAAGFWDNKLCFIP